MPVIDRKKGTSWPKIDLLKLWLDNVENDGNAIFVVIADHTLVRVCCVGDHHAILFARKFGWIIILLELLYLLLFHFDVLLALTHSHFHATILDDGIWGQLLLLLLLRWAALLNRLLVFLHLVLKSVWWFNFGACTTCLLLTWLRIAIVFVKIFLQRIECLLQNLGLLFDFQKETLWI